MKYFAFKLTRAQRERIDVFGTLTSDNLTLEVETWKTRLEMKLRRFIGELFGGLLL